MKKISMLSLAARILPQVLHSNSIDETEISIRTLTVHEWKIIIKSAIHHNIASLFYYKLRKVNLLSCLPESVLHELKDAYFLTAERNSSVLNELHEILRAFYAKNLDFLLLKGAYLANQVYDNIALRPMADIDLLVRKDDLIQVQELLISLGYSQENKSDVKEQISNHHALSPFVRCNSTPLEIHWTIFPPKSAQFNIDPIGLWDRASSVCIAGNEVQILSREDQIIHLCFHSFHNHTFRQGLLPLYDIVEFIVKNDERINWNRLIEISKTLASDKIIFTSLHTTSEIFGISLPKCIYKELMPSDFHPDLEEWITCQIYQNRSIDHSHDNKFARVLVERDSLLGSVFHIFKIAFPSKKEVCNKYGFSSSIPAIPLYAYRCFKIILKYLGSGWRLICYKRQMRLSIQREYSRKRLMDWINE